MTVMGEWTRTQQVWLLLQSVVFGVGLSAVFVVFNALAKLCGRRRYRRFAVDALFGVVAALATFFFALAYMDGRMHPLLFCGSGIGLAVPYWLVGRFVSKLLSGVLQKTARITRRVLLVIYKMLYRFFVRIHSSWEKVLKKPRNICKKSQKSEKTS